MKTKYKEINSKSQIKENLLNDKTIFNKYKLVGIFSTDYCVLKNSIYGHVNILASIDPISQFVNYVTARPTQLTKNVKIMIKNLPKQQKYYISIMEVNLDKILQTMYTKKRNINNHFHNQENQLITDELNIFEDVYKLNI